MRRQNPPPAQRLGGRPWQTEPQNGELGWLVGLLECGRALRGVKVSKRCPGGAEKIHTGKSTLAERCRGHRSLLAPLRREANGSPVPGFW